MSKARLEWRVGLFILIGLAVLGGLLLQFSKGTTFFRKTYDVLLRAPNVGGLKARAQVLMAGVQIGTIAEIRLGPQGTNVTITLRVYREFEIHKDARFVLEQSGFLGDQYVAIVPTKNQAEVFHHNDVAETEAPFNLQEVARSAAGFLQRIDETARKLNDAINDVRRQVLNEQTLTNLAVAVNNLRSVSDKALITVDSLNALVSSNGPSLGTAGSNLVHFSARLEGFAADLGGVLDTNAPVLNQAVKNIESSTVLLKNVLEDLQAGKGLAGNLLRDESLAASVSQIANNLSVTTSNLNRLGIWGVLWQRKTPREKAPASREPLASPKERN
jgi:phospholipid/cholesterol/gamma-HCH transport system substrate-binding protein